MFFPRYKSIVLLLDDMVHADDFYYITWLVIISLKNNINKLRHNHLLSFRHIHSEKLYWPLPEILYC